jgi:LysM repeat protein
VAGEATRKLAAMPLADQNPPAPAEPTQPKFYTVKAGDPLWKIAQSNQVSPVELMRVNNLLMKDWIYAGQQLVLPYPLSPKQERYTVKGGDTAWKIADRAYTSVSVLMNKNHLTNTNLVPGQMLLVGGWS